MTTTNNYNDELKDLKERLETLEETNNQILSSVTELKLGVCGSEKIGVEGMVQKTNRHEIFIQNLEVENIVQKTNNHAKYIEKDRKQKNKIVGGAMAIVFILGWLKDWILSLLTGE